MTLTELRIVIPSADCPEPEPCGDPECWQPAGTCDHVFCGTHKVWARDNGGRLVGCPVLCPPAAA